MINFSNPATTTSKNRLITPPTVVAPGLAAAGIETCLGAASGGVSVMGGGFTFGSTRIDDGCTIRLLARQLFAFGFQKAAVALMCQDERVAIAMDASGSPCPSAPLQARAYIQADAWAYNQVDASAYNHVSAVPVKPYTREEAALFARSN